jgi:cell division septation protein DedD
MRSRCLVVAVLVLGLGGPASAQSVRAGIEAWQKADYAAAVAIWRPLAEKGDADASFNLGQAYRLGRGVPTNIGAAQTWFERAARKGHVDAETTLGLLLFENGDQPAGLRWLKVAAEKGEPRALLIYGTALFNGDNVPRDPVLGYAYVSRAAAQGLKPAKETLAELDALLPVQERKKGIAIAIAKAKKAPPPAAKAAKPAAKAPASQAPSAQDPVSAAATGAWRIQLGAFSRRGSAEALFAKLAGSGTLAGRQAYYVPVGAMTRLQVGPYPSRAAAQAACNSLKGQSCFPVGAK